MSKALLKNNSLILLSFLFIALSSCGANLHEATLTIGVLNQNYTYQLAAENNDWDWFDDAEMIFGMSRGDLPNGVSVSSNGAITGVPTELGNFEFRVSVYAIDYDYDYYYDDDGWIDVFFDDDVTKDSEWYTLFVTEASTNTDCPSPSNRSTTGVLVCVGTPDVTELAADEEFTLDVNYFVDYNKADSYNITTIDFTIYYNTDYFTVGNNTLTTASLREAATRAGADVSFINNTPGTLNIYIDGIDKTFHKSGRMIDLTFKALENVPAGEHPFTITVNNYHIEGDGDSFPGISGIEGYANIVDDISVEETTTSINDDFDEPSESLNEDNHNHNNDLDDSIEVIEDE